MRGCYLGNIVHGDGEDAVFLGHDAEVENGGRVALKDASRFPARGVCNGVIVCC